jgi:hypothetical protein
MEKERRAYRKLVEDYCQAVEQPLGNPRASLLLLRDRLLSLYQASLAMPAVSDASFENLPFEISNAEFRKSEKVVATCTNLNHFWICYNPFETPPQQPVCASLADGLTDIWRDLKPGLLALAQDEDRWASDVFWDWKFGFESHWGQHAVDSIWAIHKLLRDAPPENTADLRG